METVSVILPVYDVEKYIGAVVKSVLNQTYKDFELLIVDDESPDQSVKICQQFTDPRIKIIHQKNRGPAGARNTAIRQAKGKYLALLDGDDLWLPEKLEKHIEHLESSPTVGVSFSRSAFIDEAGNFLGTYLRPTKFKEITPPYLLHENPVGPSSAAVVRREVFEAIKFQDNLYGTSEDFYFDEHFRQAEDIECWLRIAIQTKWQIEGINDALTLYRVNSEGLSASVLKFLEHLEKLIEKTRSYAPELIAEWEGSAKAYQLRYSARTAIRMQAGSMAVKLIHRALAAHWRILLEEPRRTLLTLVGAYLLGFLPSPLYYQIEAFAAKMPRAIQERQILQNQSS